ncbi:hypothetical protein LCGC14_0921380 [marine sediment metagenome]|uniref:Uncharacterized protein n=1 Tax=marine sediment metagenome TaxID=412755 RepID=A0A0F9NVJ2_9ZZZZ
MLYDVYEVRNLDESDLEKRLLERVYQPSEPMYDTTQLIKVIIERVKTQTKLTNIRVVSVGQVANVGGEPPRI